MGEIKFLTNESKIRFLDELISCLNSCSSFDFSVSFIKKAGLNLLQNSIENALKRGAKGRILTSTYQNFTDPASLEFFLALQEQYPNFECHLDYECFNGVGFHTKGYLFRFEENEEIIIGSSNVTRFALLNNKEWDLASSSLTNQFFLADARKEFENYWDATYPLTADVIKEYEYHLQFAIEKWDMDYFDPDGMKSVKPNLMQRQALKEIRRYRDMNVNKALVVAATGSGKTYLAAFDALNFGVKKLLYVVHKDTILLDAQKTFMHVFGTEKTYGLYNGGHAELDADFLFASNQMLARHLNLFAPDEFDYIVIDEVHHAAASTYRAIMEHFHPQFLLGLTATPDRMDGESVYDLFENNVPFDLRLREALENDLIVPFKYYGIRDTLIDYSDNVSAEGVRKIVMELSSQANCAFVAEQIEKYRPRGVKMMAIGFCRNKEHARLMASGMSELGYSCTYLTGENTTGERVETFRRLENQKDPLSIVFAVDILNEGVDIPAMNMALFLRPTESSTIFIQQLGRGLRKCPGKQYLTVLDFIANSYSRSVQIALALSSLTKSGATDKLTIMDHIRSDFSDLGLPIEIHLDRLSKEEVLKSIEKTNFNSLAILKADFANFKAYLKLGPNEYPHYEDFLNDEIGADLLRYTRKFDSYYEFLEHIGQSDLPYFSPLERNVISSISWYLPLARPYEYLVLKELLSGPKTRDQLFDSLKNIENFMADSFDHSLRVLLDELYATRPASHVKLVNEADGVYSLSFEPNHPSFKTWIADLIDYGLKRYESEFYGEKGKLKLYGKYTGTQVYQCLNHNNLYRMTGVSMVSGELCIFIDLNKNQKDENLNYADKFLSNKVMQWESQTGTTLSNKKGLDLIKRGKAMVFVRKAKKEDGIDLPFVYLGFGKLENPRVSSNQGKTLLFDVILEDEVPAAYTFDFGIKEVADA